MTLPPHDTHSFGSARHSAAAAPCGSIGRMSLLARLAQRMNSLNGELAATEGLGLILQNPVAAAALMAKVRAGAPRLPADLTFSTQVGDSDGRPDIVGRDGAREVLQIEGKF